MTPKQFLARLARCRSFGVDAGQLRNVLNEQGEIAFRDGVRGLLRTLDLNPVAYAAAYRLCEGLLCSQPVSCPHA